MHTKIWTVIVVLVALGLLFGCTGTTNKDTNNVSVAKVTNAKQASAAIDDVSTDISGLASSLTSIKNEFVDTNKS